LLAVVRIAPKTGWTQIQTQTAWISYYPAIEFWTLDVIDIGVLTVSETLVFESSISLFQFIDIDGDGIVDYQDTDDDNDGVLDVSEVEWTDFDDAFDLDNDGLVDFCDR
jgi:hypothetical protein